MVQTAASELKPKVSRGVLFSYGARHSHKPQSPCLVSGVQRVIWRPLSYDVARRQWQKCDSQSPGLPYTWHLPGLRRQTLERGQWLRQELPDWTKWRTGKPGVPQSMGSQRAGYDQVTTQQQQIPLALHPSSHHRIPFHSIPDWELEDPAHIPPGLGRSLLVIHHSSGGSLFLCNHEE